MTIPQKLNVNQLLLFFPSHLMNYSTILSTTYQIQATTKIVTCTTNSNKRVQICLLSYHTMTYSGWWYNNSRLYTRYITNSNANAGRSQVQQQLKRALLLWCPDKAHPHHEHRALLAQQFGVAGHNFHLAHLLGGLLILELCVRQDEGPHIVTEPVGVQMALQIKETRHQQLYKVPVQCKHNDKHAK